jgi:hypothetical protein
MKGKKNLNERLNQLEKMLEVNQIHVYQADEPITITEDTRVIRLRWLDIPDQQLQENIE